MKIPLTLVISMGYGIDTARPGRAPIPITPPIPVTAPAHGPRVSGHIKTSTTWSDTIHISASTFIEAGASVAVMPGITVDTLVDSHLSHAGVTCSSCPAVPSI